MKSIIFCDFSIHSFIFVKLFAKIGSHVMFFIKFLDDEKKSVRIVDSTRSTGKVSVRELVVEELFTSGYEVYRKKEGLYDFT